MTEPVGVANFAQVHCTLHVSQFGAADLPPPSATEHPDQNVTHRKNGRRRMTWFMSRWDALRGSFWFVPLVMVGGAILLSLATLTADQAAAERGTALALDWSFARGPEGSRAVLATVAGSMITIASVCFSITIVALQQASSQFGPRLLHNFMRDRGNQFVLGTFIAGFTYCLLILRTVNGTAEHQFVPHLSVTVGLLLALAGVAVLIYFVHHAASSIQAENVIAAVARDLRDAIDRLYPNSIGRGAADVPHARTPLPADFEATAVPVPAGASDYLQAVDADRLIRLAVEHDLVLHLDCRPGQFVIKGNPVLRAWPVARCPDEVAGHLRDAFIFGPRRTLFQDVEFAVDQLVEIALRALSPGINDPFTALACVDRLGAAVVEIAARPVPSPLRHDEKGVLRVVAEPVTMAGFADAAFHQIRQAARTNAAVTLRLLEVIAAVAPQVKDAGLRDALLSHADLIHRESQVGLPADADRADARTRYEKVKEIFALPPQA